MAPEQTARIEFRITARLAHPSLKGMEVVASLLPAGAVLSCRPDILDTTPDSPEVLYSILFAAASEAALARAHAALSADPELADVRMGPPGPAEPDQRPARELPVRVEKVQALERQVSELMAAFGRIGRSLASLDPAAGLTLPVLLERAREARARHREAAAMAQQIHAAARRLLLVPAGILLSRLQRPVRDTARDLGKQVRLELAGEETELEQSVLEELREPLLHLVRNAIGHGLETPDERLAAGKPATGTIRVEAYVAGDNFVLEIRDDGRGLDARKIGLRALQMRLVSPSDLARMNDQDIFAFIYHPGFSTADQVSTLSGRGIGMDVVKSRVTRLHGLIDVGSESGAGTTFHIRVPLSVSLIRALVVETAGHRLAIPSSAIRSVRPLAEWESLRSRGASLVSLSAALGWGERHPARVVEVGIAERRFGLGVESCLDHEELAVRSLGRFLGRVPGVSGAAILPSGLPVLVLDTAELADQLGV